MASFLSTLISADDQPRFYQHYAIFHLAVALLPVVINGCSMCPMCNSNLIENVLLSGRYWTALASGDDRPIGLCGFKIAIGAARIIYQSG